MRLKVAFLLVMYASLNLVCEPVLDEQQQLIIEELESRYLEADGDFYEILDIGLTYMYISLSGYTSFQEKAEYYLEEAFEINPDNKTISRVLGRFYNMRTLDLDFSKAEKQVEVYSAFLGDKKVGELNDSEFVGWTFFQMARAINFSEHNKMFKALSTVSDLEKNIRLRVRDNPDNVEFHALGGNFALFLAGNIPLGKNRRVREGIKYFEYVRENWENMRPGASNTVLCPNTYENFMFELGDAYLFNREKDKAIDVFTELSEIKEVVTRSKEIIAAMSRERIENVDFYSGKRGLIPPWPSDRGNCIVCHSYTVDIPMESLYSRNIVDISEIESNAEDNPLLK